MKLRRDYKKTLLVAVSLLILLMGGMSLFYRARYQEPYDGVNWEIADNGFILLKPEEGSPSAEAGIEPEDTLLKIDGRKTFPNRLIREVHWLVSSPGRVSTIITKDGKVIDSLSEEINPVTELNKALYNIGIGGEIRYTILREGKMLESTLRVQGVPLPNNDTYYYLCFVGFCFFLVGLSVLYKKRLVPASHHFYWLCICFFVLFTFSPTVLNAPLKRAVFWGDEIARVMLPAIFLHFFLVFPRRKRFVEKRKLNWILYIPGAVFILLNALFLNYLRIFPSARGELIRNYNQQFALLSKTELAYLGLFMGAGIIALLHSYRYERSFVARQQIRWVLWGTGLGILPVVAVYIPFYLLGAANPLLTLFAIIPLLLIPISLSYAIAKYRLMDVEVIIKRAMVAGLAILAILGIYLLIIRLANLLIPAELSPELLSAVMLLATLLVAVIFSPLRKKIQGYLDKLMYRSRYDIRSTIQEFNRELSSIIKLPTLMERITQHVSAMLQMEDIGIFLWDEKKKTYKLSKSLSEIGKKQPLYMSDVLSAFLPSALKDKDYLVLSDIAGVEEEFIHDQELLSSLKVTYLIPFVSKGEIKGLLSLGRKKDGSWLSSEDLELAAALSGSAAMAIENAILYQSVEKKAAELEALQEFNDNLLESLNAGILVVDLHQRIISWNRKLEELCQIKRSRAMGKKLDQVLPADFLHSINSLMSPEGWSSSQLFNLYKLNLVNKKGRKSVINLSISPLFTNEHRFYGKIVIFDDITDQVNLEDQLLQAEKLASLGFLAAGIAHEVNTPLTGISSYTQMLMREVDDSDPKSEILHKMEQQTFRASQIVNNLLNFARQSKGQFTELDVNQVITDTISLFEYQLRSSGIKLKLNLEDSPPPIRGDKGKLQQLLLNLLKNATESMPQGGELGISSKTENDSVLVSIRDTGAGIAKENLPKIYDPFFTTKKGRHGTGLGLSVSYGIIQEHSGSISVKSSLGKGTDFIIKLPALKVHYEEKR
ncbi:MAG: ATP-binding protein [Candidatus Aminicenantes bacterium]|nr:ATP-binding protein [Candidatus Aminicenantes bacterium]